MSTHTNHVHRTINRYHHYFESYRDVITYKSLWTWISVISLLGFLFFLGWYFRAAVIPTSDFEKGSRLALCVFFEITALLSWFRLQVLRNKEVVRRCQYLFDTNEDSISALKAKWLEVTLQIPRESYLELAEDIDRMMSLKERHKPSFSFDLKGVAELIFAAESKGRVLIMFMGVSAGFIALSIAGGATIDSIFEFYGLFTLSQTLIFIGTVSFVVMLTFQAMKYAALFCLHGIEVFVEKNDGLKTASNRRAGVFINQLLLFYHLKKGRVRVALEENQSEPVVD